MPQKRNRNRAGRLAAAAACALFITGLALAAGAAQPPAVPLDKIKAGPAAKAPAKKAPARKTVTKKSAKTTTATLPGTKKETLSAEEQAYWELCRRRINSEKEPGELIPLVREMLDFAEKHKKSPFGARALVDAADVESTLGSYKEALEHYQQAEVALRVNSNWKTGQDYLPYIGLRTGDALSGMNNNLGALAMWKKTLAAYPGSSFASQCLSKVVDVTAKVMPPGQAWMENYRFLDEAIKNPGFSPEVRTAAQIARLKVLSDAVDMGNYPPWNLVEEIDKFLKNLPQGKNPAFEGVRATLEKLRLNAEIKARVRPAAPSSGNIYRKMADGATSAPAAKAPGRLAPSPAATVGVTTSTGPQSDSDIEREAMARARQQRGKK